VLSPGIPGKGELLTTLSMWWFDRLAGADGGRSIPNHLAEGEIPEAVAGRAMIVRSLDMQPIECVVRGYLTGSGWNEYRAHGTVCGIRLETGLGNGDRLPAPIFTPAYKAPLGEHDENITFDQTVRLVGADRAEDLRDLSLEIYERAAATAEQHGLILADTKFEFGVDDDGVLTLADEVLTSDSSRYWDAAAWASGTTPDERMASFDKQIVRDWLADHWDNNGAPPVLPDDVVTRTADRYRELLRRLID
jgi:phosphoribosylaminoimidazole-succinocarboxamide synthase